ncbi:hypothetical protein D3C75_1089770 [compost metagenome]
MAQPNDYILCRVECLEVGLDGGNRAWRSRLALLPEEGLHPHRHLGLVRRLHGRVDLVAEHAVAMIGRMLDAGQPLAAGQVAEDRVL